MGAEDRSTVVESFGNNELAFGAGHGSRITAFIYIEPNSDEEKKSQLPVTDVFLLTTPVFLFIYIGLLVSQSS